MLNAEIMQRYDLVRDWRAAGFYETDNHRHLAQTLRIGRCTMQSVPGG